MNKLGSYISKLMTTVLDTEQEQFVKDLALNELTRLNIDVNDFIRKHTKDDIDENTDDVAVTEEKTLVGLIWTPTKGLDVALNKSDWTKGDTMNCGAGSDETCGETSDDNTKINFQFKF